MYRLGDRIIVTLGDEAYELRPSLRHAMVLARREGGFQALAREIEEGSLTAAIAILRPQVEPEASPILDTFGFRVLAALRDLRAPLAAFLSACAGFDPDNPPKDGKVQKIVPFPEYLAGLYRVGTGWLGWTPEQTLDAIPVEIIEAHRGRLDMLKTIFGSSEDSKAKKRLPFTDDNVMALFGIEDGKAA